MINRILQSALASMFLASSLRANAGDLITNVNLPVTGFGPSVAVDCMGNVYYTLDSNTNLFVMDKTGALVTTLPIIDAATGGGLLIDEMAFDSGRNTLWACLHNSNPVAIYQVNPATGAATFQWNSATISIGTFRDGLAYDASDDSLWVSGDVSTTIEHHTAAGVFLGSLTPKDAAGGTLGSISGVSVGVGDLLYLGRDGFQQIVQVKKSNGDFIAVFASPGGARDEGLECDAVNFFPLVALWSREFNSPGFMSVIELDPGSCACGGEQVTPFCFGNDPAVPCPCANAGSPGNGCANSDHAGGARLAAAGAPSLAADTLVLTATDIHSSSLAIFVQGDTVIAPMAFGDGLRCIAGILRLFKVKQAHSSTVSAPSLSSLPPTPATVSGQSAAHGDTLSPGDIRGYQVYYRDPIRPFCPNPPGDNFNITNAIRVTWGP